MNLTTRRLLRFFLSLASVALALLAVEGLLRFGSPVGQDVDPLVDRQADFVRGPYSALFAYHSRLGWVPRSHVRASKRGVPVTTGDDGIRLNGQREDRRRQRSRILAVGDSFTFGDEVPDADTWPALLERGLAGGAPAGCCSVLNAGVSSYGLDQTVLRAEALVPKYHPRLVIVSFIQDDINRLVQRVRNGVPKPYFEVTPEGLVLRNVPTPPPRAAPNWIRRRLLAHSSLAQFIIQWGPEPVRNLLGAGTMIENVDSRGDADAIAVAVIERLLALQRKHRFPLILLLQSTGVEETVDPAMTHVLEAALGASEGSVAIINAIDAIRAQAAADSGGAASLFHTRLPNHHMSPAGNAYIAKLLLPVVLASLGQDD